MSNEQAVVAYRSAMLPQTFDQVVQFAQMVARTQFCPQAFRNKPEDCLAAITYGAELGLSPMQALRGVAIINGQPSAYGDTLLAVCQAHPQWGGKEERVHGGGNLREAICVVRRKGEPDTEARFSVADAQLAGLWGKAGPWKMYPDRMLKMRARGFALRDAFADALRGIITADEASDWPEHRGPDNAREINPGPKANERRAAMAAVESVEMIDGDGEVHYVLPGEVEQFMRDHPDAAAFNYESPQARGAEPVTPPPVDHASPAGGLSAPGERPSGYSEAAPPPRDGNGTRKLRIWLGPLAQIEAPAKEALAELKVAIQGATSVAEWNALLENNDELLRELKGGNRDKMSAAIDEARKRLDALPDDSWQLGDEPSDDEART